MDGRIFDGLISGMITIGVLIGLGLAGLGWLLWWLFQHVQIAWVK